MELRVSYPICPAFAHKRFGPLNITESVVQACIEKHEGELTPVQIYNLINTPMYLDTLLQIVHAEMSLDYSFGGYLEWRELWLKETYLKKEKKYLHQGVDINVPIGTGVAVSRACKVVDLFDDTPDQHGWGGRVTVLIPDRVHSEIYLTYAHLECNPFLEVGQELAPGDFIGRVGKPERNGGWFPHIHVQAWIRQAYQYYFVHKNALPDGYTGRDQLVLSARTCPYPMQWVDLN